MIRNLRLKKNVEQKAAAKAIGISSSYYCRIESGQVPLPPAYYVKASRFFGVPVEAMVRARMKLVKEKLWEEIKNGRT